MLYDVNNRFIWNAWGAEERTYVTLQSENLSFYFLVYENINAYYSLKLDKYYQVNDVNIRLCEEEFDELLQEIKNSGYLLLAQPRRTSHDNQHHTR